MPSKDPPQVDHFLAVPRVTRQKPLLLRRGLVLEEHSRETRISCAENVSGFSFTVLSGGLENITGSPFKAGNEPQSIAVDPSGSFVYVAKFR